ncbi:hypothetical protein H4R24_002278 [Coemansia sp. RSA 988]|nr:hypothetical protein H4R24_002278 [Coemansia sp. RSA 988]
MERDSEVETVLADEEWLGILSENTQRNRTRRHETSIENSSDSFDEELFSSSGSLSSLHEFSDGGADGASSETDSRSADSSCSGPIIRNGTTPLDKGSSGGKAMSEVLAESELDTEGDDRRHPPDHSRRKKLARNTQNRRKVISEDEDDGDGEQSDAENGGNGKSVALARHESHTLQDVRNKSAAMEVCEMPTLSRTMELNENEDDVSEGPNSKLLGKRELGNVASSPRKHRSIKRRKVHYGDPDYTDGDGCPQLVYFASRGDAATCRKLLLRGASISAADTHGWTSLHEAAKHGHIETLELLLDPPARARQQQQQEEISDSNGLDMADSRLVRQLHSLFPDVNATTLHSRQTPLHQAIASDNIAAVRLLLDHGALTNITNSQQLTPLDTCSNENIARLLTDKAKMQRNVAIRDKAGQTKLHRACNAGDLGQVVALINQGAGINIKDNAGWTPLHEAALEGRSAVVVALLRHNADFAARGFGGDTPLHDACANGHVDVVRSLLIAGADTTLKNSKGITPEAMARDEEHNEVLQVIDGYRQSGLCTTSRTSDFGSGQRTVGGVSGIGKGKRPTSAKSADTTTAKENSAQARSRTASPAMRTIERVSPLQSRKSREKQSKVMHSRRLDSHNQNAPSTSANKRELVSLKRLREEAEKPMVNYYFSSTSSKLSRDERKLQVLMGTIERMEKRRPKERRRISAESIESPHDEPAELSVDSADPHNASVIQSEPKDDELAPKRRRGRPSKKRPADDNDERENMEKKGNSEASIRKTNQKQRLGTKKPKYDTEEQSTTAESYAQRGVVTIDGSGSAIDSKVNHTPPPPSHSTLFDEVSATAEPTVAIKTEPVVVSGEHALVRSPSPVVVTSTQPTQSRVNGISNRKSAARNSAAGGRKYKARQNVEEGGRTIVEDASRTQQSATLTSEAIAARAIRYLPLYTIQLHSDPPTSKLDYFVVDLQIRLLLGMSIDTPSEDSADEDDISSNPLFQRYTHLCRQRITESQKEHLWEPLASMFVSNIQLIHDSNSSLAAGRAIADSADGKVSKSKAKKGSGSLTAAADKEVVNKFTLHERSRFVALDLYFVKLDEVVKIIRQDYPQISKHLITITLDLSSIGLADVATTSTTMTAPTMPRPRLVADINKEAEAGKRRPVWTGPQKMLPLRYALKLHYRDHLQYLKHNADVHE